MLSETALIAGLVRSTSTIKKPAISPSKKPVSNMLPITISSNTPSVNPVCLVAAEYNTLLMTIFAVYDVCTYVIAIDVQLVEIKFSGVSMSIINPVLIGSL
jgi:hypothetical protein